METGCALLALVFVVAAIWWFIQQIVSKSAKEKTLEARFAALEAELATVRAAVDRLHEGDESSNTAAVPSAPSGQQPVVAKTPSAAPSRATNTEGQPRELDSVVPGDDVDSVDELASVESGSSGIPTPSVAHASSPGPSQDAATPINTPARGSGGPVKGDSGQSTDTPARPTINWEQWVGVRGLAVLAGIVLAIAGIYFVRFSIEQGFFPPIVRIALLMISGVLAVGFGERLRSRGYIFPANAMQGAGIVMLYASVWSARNLYDLIGSGVAFALLALITAAGGALAVRHDSLIIAILGLVGGFATPLLVSSGSNNAVGLFGYLLLLNAGIALVGRRAQWPILSALSLAATVIYQGAWIFGAMEERVVTGLVVLGLFALFFLWSSERSRPEDAAQSPQLRLGMTLGALFSPFIFALYFASQAELGSQLLPLGSLLLLLNLAAAWIARKRSNPELALGMVAATLGVLAVWPIARSFTERSLLEVLVGLLTLSALHLLAAVLLDSGKESDLRSAESTEPEPAPGVPAHGPTLQAGSSWRWELPFLSAALASIFGVTVLHGLQWSMTGATPWYLAGVLLLAAGLLYQARRLTQTTRRAQAWIPAAGAALGTGAFFFTSIALRTIDPDAGFGIFDFPHLMILAALVGVCFQIVAVQRQTLLANQSDLVESGRPSFEYALALFPIAALTGLLIGSMGDGPLSANVYGLVSATSVLMAAFLLLAATRLRGGSLVIAAVTGVAAVQNTLLSHLSSASVGALASVTVAILLLVFWPSFLPRKPVSDSSPTWPLSAWRVTALAPALLAPAFHNLFVESFGDRMPALSVLVLSAITVVALRAATRRATAEQLTSVQAWFGAVALGFLAIAVPLQLEREWITVGWALLATGIAALWLRVDHPGLKLFAVGLAAAVTIRLLLNVEVLSYHEPRAPFGLPVLGWLLYTYLLPAIALIGAARLFERREAERLRSWEPLQHKRTPWVAATLGGLGLMIAFAWVNLTIFDAYASTHQLQVALDRSPARDLTLSLAWGLYALFLLGLGVVRASKVLRWTSLFMIFATFVKVFLYDLGELEDLYRVGSLVGLAFSLLTVSVLYQRFVFRPDTSHDKTPPTTATDENPLSDSQDPDPNDEDIV